MDHTAGDEGTIGQLIDAADDDIDDLAELSQRCVDAGATRLLKDQLRQLLTKDGIQSNPTNLRRLRRGLAQMLRWRSHLGARLRRGEQRSRRHDDSCEHLPARHPGRPRPAWQQRRRNRNAGERAFERERVGARDAGGAAIELDPALVARAQIEELVRSNPRRVGEILSRWASEETAGAR